MTNAVDEMKKAAEATSHENFMGFCEGGMPLVAFEDSCRFCGARRGDKCGRRWATAQTNGE
jgi:hypothetical protein